MNASDLELHTSTAHTAHAPSSLLQVFYEDRHDSPPALHMLKGDDVPQPYRRLLVHSRDMTPTLQDFYGFEPGLSVLARKMHSGQYLREVVLRVQGVPVEYGVIRIYLSRFPEHARELITTEQTPLGAILLHEQIAHFGWPQAFFSLQADEHMARIFDLEGPTTLYGRRNVLLDGSRRLLAEVLEILAPVTQEKKQL